MKHFPSLICLAVLAWLAPAAPGASPVVSNVTACQRAETKLVVISFDVTADTPTVNISLEISSDGGTIFSVPATTTNGAIGAETAIGVGKTITWDAGVDWNQQYNTQMRFKVTATDTPPPPPDPTKFSLIPAGDFQMGDALDGLSDAPVHTVNISAFYMQKKGVTKAEWDVVRTWGLTHGYTDLAAGAGKATNHPVQTVSWYEVVKWCNARSEQESLTPCYYTDAAQTVIFKTGTNNIDSTMVKWTANGYRLPTEAEREKASRGGQVGLRFPWGNTISHANANLWNAGGESYQTGPGSYDPIWGTGAIPYTSPTGSFAANAYGIYDMAGNVWEWCWDWYGSGYYVSSPGTDPTGPSGSRRVLRGGGWNGIASYCRVASRSTGSPGGPDVNFGFRPVRKSAPVGGSALATTSNVVVDTRAKVKLTIDTQHGTVTGAGEYSPSSTAILTATADPGYVFSAWTGDVSGSANPLSLLMDTNKTVGATLVPDLSDTDGDLLTAYDEVTIHRTDPTKADTDGDGLNDGFELGIGRFSVVSGNRTWAQSKAHAESQGGNLATFVTEGEWIRAMLSITGGALYDIGGLWIGATDETTEGTWAWITGEAFGFSNWAVDQPDNLNDSDYAAVAGDLGGTAGKWYDYRGSTTRDGYILETGYPTDPTDPDCDNDGLDDGLEALAGSNPFVADTDGDGLSDAQEVHLTDTNPNLVDTDGDGLNDAADDQDGDSLTNLAELAQHGTDPLKADTDGDGLNDGAELQFPGGTFQVIAGTFTHAQATADATARRGRVASFQTKELYLNAVDKVRLTVQGYLWIGLSDTATEGEWIWTDGISPAWEEWLSGQPDGSSGENHVVIMENSIKWADTADNFVAAGYLFERPGLDPLAPDTDGDGLNDGEEVKTTLSDPTKVDTDGDGLLDGEEVNTHHSSPLKDDTDADGLDDRLEVEVHHTNPALADTDNDGFDDLFEINTGFKPTLATSTPEAMSRIRTAVEFEFNAAKDVSYRIEGSTDLAIWGVVEAAVTGTGGTISRLYSIKDQPNRYFRAMRN